MEKLLQCLRKNLTLKMCVYESLKGIFYVLLLLRVCEILLMLKELQLVPTVRQI